ncbi:MAG: hypothetical protein AAGK00_20250 [Pseudomonadota bacterium]
MGSPIDSWEGAGAFFTGAGGSTPGIILALSMIAVVAAIAYGAYQEEKSHKSDK